ncbi:MAG: hypothetical protein HYV09_14965 [Deltaproteobacteria bacterium]|nr:hypothetical protein [Deltaproteobacteria bacterium]
MSEVEPYDVWRGTDAWAAWTKAALFATADGVELPPESEPQDALHRWMKIDTSWLEPPPGSAAHRGPDARETAIIVDLDGAEAIYTGVALVSRGFRPIVAINTTAADSETVDMVPVLEALRAVARVPEALDARPDAAPAFVLDARRMRPDRPRLPGILDNRWMVFASDLPSARLLRQHGMTQVLAVYRGELQPDLADLLARYRRGGLGLLAIDLDGAQPAPSSLEIDASALGLTLRSAGRTLLIPQRNADGSFGRRVPIPSHG